MGTSALRRGSDRQGCSDDGSRRRPPVRARRVADGAGTTTALPSVDRLPRPRLLRHVPLALVGRLRSGGRLCAVAGRHCRRDRADRHRSGLPQLPPRGDAHPFNEPRLRSSPALVPTPLGVVASLLIGIVAVPQILDRRLGQVDDGGIGGRARHGYAQHCRLAVDRCRECPAPARPLRVRRLLERGVRVPVRPGTERYRGGRRQPHARPRPRCWSRSPAGTTHRCGG